MALGKNISLATLSLGQVAHLTPSLFSLAKPLPSKGYEPKFAIKLRNNTDSPRTTRSAGRRNPPEPGRAAPRPRPSPRAPGAAGEASATPAPRADPARLASLQGRYSLALENKAFPQARRAATPTPVPTMFSARTGRGKAEGDGRRGLAVPARPRSGPARRRLRRTERRWHLPSAGLRCALQGPGGRCALLPCRR